MTKIPDLTHSGEKQVTVEIDENDSLIMPDVGNQLRWLTIKRIDRKYVEIGHKASTAEAGFDYTSFETAENFVEVLEEIGLDAYYDYVRVNTARWDTEVKWYCFIWGNENGMIICGNNPITGEYRTEGRFPEKGYASYMGIEGADLFVQRATDVIRNNQQVTIKGYDQYNRSFI